MRQLLLDPDPRLRKVCQEVTTVTSQIIDLAAEMQEWILGKGYGLAAPQFGELIRLIVIEVPGMSATMVNPKLVKTIGSRRLWERCLSLPGRIYLVQRPKVVKVRWTDLQEASHTTKAHDTLAQVLMHELEHLQGIMLDNVAQAFSEDNHTHPQIKQL